MATRGGEFSVQGNSTTGEVGDNTDGTDWVMLADDPYPNTRPEFIAVNYFTGEEQVANATPAVEEFDDNGIHTADHIRNHIHAQAGISLTVRQKDGKKWLEAAVGRVNVGAFMNALRNIDSTYPHWTAVLYFFPTLTTGRVVIFRVEDTEVAAPTP